MAAELDEAIHLVEYDPVWPVLFEREAYRIVQALPLGLAIEHIGSTAVPGLLAKPIVDIMVGAESQGSLDEVRAKLRELGYEDMGEAGVPGRLYFRRRGEESFNVSMVQYKGPIWMANAALRDYLRQHPQAAAEYARTKLAALQEGCGRLLAYSDYKSGVVRRLIEQALHWNSEQHS